ncbi:lactate permease LctP family transporter [Thermoactinomyces sp. CICC 24226]|jgi:lactate permease|uniref:lactate permease LctP family transporter n=1 Tax=Thermoactinomyces sp. CICC 24226 TaxID=2767431 RepID=UPI0018DD8FAE|nr:lactate permease LctP family transporter [Thermoactinomyces sp. CICC 24226]MBI0392008.1 lactate permease LctP family transporter [Thermoactinomyces sp. CICC 24226]
MNLWTQTYYPLESSWLSALIAAVPIAFFVISLTILRLKGHIAAIYTTLIALAIAILFYHMPVPMAAGAAGFGFAYGLWPIAWIVITAVLLYKITVKTGQFDVIRSSIIAISQDQRLQLLLIGFSFNAFLEGAAGFGVPIAISAALLVQLGFKPLQAASLCLIANAASGAYGAIGIPVIVAGQVSGIDKMTLSKILGIQLPVISFLVPFLMVWMIDRFRGIKETFPALMAVAGSYTLTQYLTVTWIGPELANITSSLISMGALVLLSRYWKPKKIFQLQHGVPSAPPKQVTLFEVVKAWSPFYILTGIIGLWSSHGFKQLFDPGGPLAFLTTYLKIPGLHQKILIAPPIADKLTPYDAILKLDWVSSTGTAIFLSVLLTLWLFRMDLKTTIQLVKETWSELWKPVITIGFVLSFAYVANYSGISSTLGLTLAKTGGLFPFFSPVLGWLGVFLTGSVVANNALFANLQLVTAHQIGASPAWLVAANTSGGVIGKLLSPQSVAIATAAVGKAGQESGLFRKTLKVSLSFLLLTCIFTYLLSFLFH